MPQMPEYTPVMGTAGHARRWMLNQPDSANVQAYVAFKSDRAKADSADDRASTFPLSEADLGSAAPLHWILSCASASRSSI